MFFICPLSHYASSRVVMQSYDSVQNLEIIEPMHSSLWGSNNKKRSLFHMLKTTRTVGGYAFSFHELLYISSFPRSLVDTYQYVLLQVAAVPATNHWLKKTDMIALYIIGKAS